MDCRNESEREALIAYCAGRLSAEESAAILAHLRECPDCADFVRAQSAAWKALDHFEAPPVSAGFDRALQARLEAGENRRWWQLPLWKPALSIALAFLLMIAVAVVGRRPAVPPAPRPGEQIQAEAIDADRIERALDDVDMLRQLNLPDDAQQM